MVTVLVEVEEAVMMVLVLVVGEEMVPVEQVHHNLVELVVQQVL